MVSKRKAQSQLLFPTSVTACVSKLVESACLEGRVAGILLGFTVGRTRRRVRPPPPQNLPDTLCKAGAALSSGAEIADTCEGRPAMCPVASCYILYAISNKGRSRCWLNHARLVRLFTLSGHVVWRQCFPLRVVFSAAASGVLR